MTPILRTQLEAAAAVSGRPVSEEIESRLERSFWEERVRDIVREEIRAARPDVSGVVRVMDDLCGPTAYHRINGRQ